MLVEHLPAVVDPMLVEAVVVQLRRVVVLLLPIMEVLEVPDFK